MPRLFLAYRPPAHVCDALSATMVGVEGARWQDDDQLHLTLRYVGEVDPRVAEDTASALASFRAGPVEARVDGVGMFDRRGRAESIHALVVLRAPLAGLHRKLDRLMVLAGLPPEGRAYVPHITLARLGRSAGDPAAWLARHAGLALPRFTVDHVALFESTLGGEGAVYEEILRVPLR